MAGEVIQYQTADSITASRVIKAPSAVKQHLIEATAKVKKLAADKPAEGKGGAV